MRLNSLNESNVDGWWVDFIEAELDPSILEDVRWLLKHSPSDRETVREFQELRQALADCDWGEPYWREEDWKRLHDKIVLNVWKTADSAESQSSAQV